MISEKICKSRNVKFKGIIIETISEMVLKNEKKEGVLSFAYFQDVLLWLDNAFCIKEIHHMVLHC